MKCPVCPDTSLSMTDRQGIEIDYCPQCRGVWLDRGELDKIIERTGAAPAPKQQFRERSGYPQGRDDSHSYSKRKKHLLKELFDF